MDRSLSMQDVAGWLSEMTTFDVSLGASDDKRAELTVFKIYPVTVEAGDGILAVTCGRKLPPEVQSVVDIAEVRQVAFGSARSAAMPTVSEAREVDGEQWVSFRALLFLDGLTRNELANAVWEVWKAQELLALQIDGMKRFEALSSELEADLPPAEDAAETPGAPSGGRFCHKCGTKAGPEQRFCNACGASLEG